MNRADAGHQVMMDEGEKGHVSCAGDVKCFSGVPLFWGDEYRQAYCQPPVTPGHEFVGEVVALGEGAAEKSGLAIGDLAISEQIVPCWKCRFCQRGQYWMCEKHDIYGFRQRAPGAMAEYIVRMRLPQRVRGHLDRASAGPQPRTDVLSVSMSLAVQLDIAWDAGRPPRVEGSHGAGLDFRTGAVPASFPGIAGHNLRYRTEILDRYA